MKDTKTRIKEMSRQLGCKGFGISGCIDIVYAELKVDMEII